MDRYLPEVTARVLDLSPERIEPDRPLFHLGLDSLMAVEPRTAVRAELRMEILIVDLLEALSMRSLAVAVLGALEADGRHR